MRGGAGWAQVCVGERKISLVPVRLSTQKRTDPPRAPPFVFFSPSHRCFPFVFRDLQTGKPSWQPICSPAVRHLAVEPPSSRSSSGRPRPTVRGWYASGPKPDTRRSNQSALPMTCQRAALAAGFPQAIRDYESSLQSHRSMHPSSSGPRVATFGTGNLRAGVGSIPTRTRKSRRRSNPCTRRASASSASMRAAGSAVNTDADRIPDR